jgi:riboflavin transporter
LNNLLFSNSSLYRFISIALLGTISAVLMFINFPLPFLPTYLRIDISDLPALLGGLLFNPVAAIVVLAIKNLLYLLLTAIYDPIGAIANFIAGILFVVPVSFMYYKYRTNKSVWIGLVIGAFLLIVGMSVMNYFVILPIYSSFIGWDTFTQNQKWTLIITAIIPFNLIKAILVGNIFYFIFLKLNKYIKKKRID